MAAEFQSILEFLLPGKAERDEGFRQEILRLSQQGLRVIGNITIAAPVLMFVLQRIVTPNPLTLKPALIQMAALVLIGAADRILTGREWSRFRARVLAGVSGWLIASVLIVTSLWIATVMPKAVHYIPAQITTVMLVGVAAAPLLPWQTLALGLSIHAVYVAGLLAAGAFDPNPQVFLFMITGLSTGLSAVIYAQRSSNYLAHQEALRVTRDLRQAQSRALLADNAASLGRLAAVMSHELNSPLGALTSAVDSLLVLAARQAGSEPLERQRLDKVRDELKRSVAASTERLQEIATRMQRLTYLDRAEIQSANMSELLRDIVALFEPQLAAGVKLEMNFQPLPPLVCRPQHLSAVFSSLLGHAIKAVNGSGRIVLSTRKIDSSIEVSIQDNGPGMSAEELATIFDAGFKVSGGRVATGDWSLFGARQVIQDHRGDIRVQSEAGKSTTAIVTLPC